MGAHAVPPRDLVEKRLEHAMGARLKCHPKPTRGIWRIASDASCRNCRGHRDSEGRWKSTRPASAARIAIAMRRQSVGRDTVSKAPWSRYEITPLVAFAEARSSTRRNSCCTISSTSMPISAASRASIAACQSRNWIGTSTNSRLEPMSGRWTPSIKCTSSPVGWPGGCSTQR